MSVNIFSSKKIVGAKGLSGLWARQTFFDLSIGIDETNTFQLKFFIFQENCGRHRFMGVRVIVAYSRNKLALRTRLRNQNLKSKFSTFDSFRDVCVHFYDFLKFVGGLLALKWAWQSFWAIDNC